MKKDSVNLDNEYLCLSYYLRNPKQINQQTAGLFMNPITKSVAGAITRLQEKGLEFSLETLYNLARQEKEFDFSILDNIYNNFTDYANIEYHIKELESDYTKNVIARNILIDLIGKSQSGAMISTQEILSATDNIRRALITTLDTAILKDTKALSEEYLEILDERRDKDRRNRRSIGFRVLDEQLTRPAAPKELTIIAALSGSGKSSMKQAMQNNLIAKGIPTLDFSLEMSNESNMDRIVSMRAGISGFDLNKNITSNELYQKTRRVLDDFQKYKNFLSTDESALTFDHIDSLLYKAKEIFYKRGLLQDDEYVIYSIDLLNMVMDFGESTPTDILAAMDQWFRINKKHNCHGVGLVQINENKLRKITFNDPDDIDRYRPNLEDIYGGSAYRQRARTVMLLHRPLDMKMRFFPELKEEWERMDYRPLDIMECHIAKQTGGSLFLQKFVFDPSVMRIVPLMENFNDD